MERTNEDKLELFADLLEPAGALIQDREWAAKWLAGDRFGAIRAAIKNHKAEIVEILARIEGVEPEAYRIDGVALFFKLVQMFDRPDLEMVNGLFTSRDQNGEGASSGPATANTGDGGN